MQTLSKNSGMAATAKIVTITALLQAKAKIYLITDVKNVDPLLSNKLNIS